MGKIIWMGKMRKVVKMSSLFSHIFIPLVILFIFANKLKLNNRNIIMLSFFGILSDADAYIFIHRASFHNVFILIIPILLFIFIKDIKIWGIMTFYLLSHIILDIFNGGVFLLYPLYDNVFFFRAYVWFNDGGMMPTLYYGISDNIVPMLIGRGEPMISSENIGTAILLIMVSVVSIFKKRLGIEIIENIILNRTIKTR